MSTFIDPEAQEREAHRQEFKRVVAENPQVALSCDCGWSWEGPSAAVEWITDRHAQAHNKGAWVPGREGQERLCATGQICARPAGARSGAEDSYAEYEALTDHRDDAELLAQETEGQAVQDQWSQRGAELRDVSRELGLPGSGAQEVENQAER